MILLDSSAWIEMFRGTVLGNRIHEKIKNHILYTSVLSIAEVTKWCFENNLSELPYIQLIEEGSTLIPLKRKELMFAGKICVEHKKKIHNFGLIDACIYTSGYLNGSKIITTDHHFKGLDNVEILE